MSSVRPDTYHKACFAVICIFKGLKCKASLFQSLKALNLLLCPGRRVGDHPVQVGAAAIPSGLLGTGEAAGLCNVPFCRHDPLLGSLCCCRRLRCPLLPGRHPRRHASDFCMSEIGRKNCKERSMGDGQTRRFGVALDISHKAWNQRQVMSRSSNCDTSFVEHKCSCSEGMLHAACCLAPQQFQSALYSWSVNNPSHHQFLNLLMQGCTACWRCRWSRHSGRGQTARDGGRGTVRGP